MSERRAIAQPSRRSSSRFLKTPAQPGRRCVLRGLSSAPVRDMSAASRLRRHTVTVIVEREGPVAVITIDRPQARNAVDPATAARLFEAFNESERDDACLATVLTGAA